MAEPYTIERYESREAWLDARRRGLGASDAAVVLGLSRWQSPYGLWVDKTEPLVADEMDEIARWGLLLEPVICEELNRRIGTRREVCRIAQNTIYRSTERPHLHYSPDAETDSGEPCQLKTAHFAQAAIWKNKVPIAYVCNMQHEMYVSGADCGFIAVLKDGYEFAWHRVVRNERFLSRMLPRLDAFWGNHVLKRQPPPLDFSDATRRAIGRFYPADDSTTVDLPDDSGNWIEEKQRLDAEIKERQQKVDLIENRIRAAIGTASYGRLWDGSGFSYKLNGHGTRTLRRVKKVSEPNE